MRVGWLMRHFAGLPVTAECWLPDSGAANGDAYNKREPRAESVAFSGTHHVDTARLTPWAARCA